MGGLKMATKKGGKTLGVPNVVKIPAPPAPPIPTPLLYNGDLATAEKSCPDVLAHNMETLNEGSELPSGKGDEPGSAGGLVSGTHGDKATPKAGSSVVKLGPKNALYMTGTIGCNGASANQPAGLIVSVDEDAILVLP